MVTGVAGLTIQGIWDRHAFRENWANLGGAVTVLFKDPGQLFSALIDLEGLRNNPTHWTGAFVPEVVAAIFTGGALNTAAKAGNLGTTLQHLTTKLDNVKATAGLSTTSRITSAERNLLLDELAAQGIKHSSEEIVHIGRRSDGTLITLRCTLVACSPFGSWAIN